MSENFKSFREQSRMNWGKESDRKIYREDLSFGCLLRIADATEAMAENHLKMQSTINYLKEKSARLQTENETLRRSNAGLKSYITRLKNKK